jgi:Na+-driven multidrug efflux pump
VTKRVARHLPQVNTVDTGPGLLRLAAPLVLSFVLRAAFGLVDRLYAAGLEGLADASQAAIGLSTPIDFLMIACWVGASNGLTRHFAQAIGAGESQKVRQLRAAGRVLTLVLGAFFFALALVIWFRPTLFAPANEPDVVRQFQIYSAVVVGGSAFTMFWSIVPDSLVKAHHDTVATMKAGLISSLLNVALNTLFVFAFGWGIFGIAFSTVLGRIGGTLYAWKRANEHEARRLAKAGQDRPGSYDDALRAVLAIAVPSSLVYALMSVESFVVNEILKRGPDAESTLAAWSAFDGVGRFFLMPAIATGVAILPLAARWRGAGVPRERLLGEVGKGFGALCLYAALCVAPLVFAAPTWLAHQFVEDERSIAFAAEGFRWLPLVVIFAGGTILVRPLFDVFDRSRLGLALALVRTFVIVVPLFLLGGVLAEDFGYARMSGWFAASTLSSLLGLAATFGLLVAVGAFGRRVSANDTGARSG